MKYFIHEDGSFDILGEEISLKGCYPFLQGAALHPLRMIIDTFRITYILPKGNVSLSFQEKGCDGIALVCSAEGLTGLHDIAPLGQAAVRGAGKMFAQGFGMEGPSGLFGLEEDVPVSHGLTAISGNDSCLVIYAKDHTRFSTAFRWKQDTGLFGVSGNGNEAVPGSFTGGFNLEGTAGDHLELPALYFEEFRKEDTGLTEALRLCAGKIAESMHARKGKPPAFFWSSWYYAYQTLDQKTLEKNLDEIRREKIPFQYIEIDAGYSPSIGDWLIPNHRWPGGLQAAARTILEAGYQPGIWVAPFIVGDCSELYRNHPDWVLHDREGKPVVQLRSYTEPKIWGNPDCDYFVLDTSHPEALKYLEDVFKTLKNWGFSFFKTDFMLWNMHDSSAVRRYDPALTSVEILRKTLAVIRGAIGEESYLLGCIAPFMPFIGYADGMRLAGDCGAQWEETFGPVNMLRELPCDNYFNHVFWQNDPDAMLLRNFGTSLTAEETRSLALLQALSGGAVSTSDPVSRLAEDRKQLLGLVEPAEAVTPSIPCFESRGKELVLTHQLPQGNLLFVMNPEDAPRTVSFRLSGLFGDKEWFWYRYRWEDEEVCPEREQTEGEWSVREDVFSQTLAPHASALLFITDEPLKKKPSNLWKW